MVTTATICINFGSRIDNLNQNSPVHQAEKANNSKLGITRSVRVKLARDYSHDGIISIDVGFADDFAKILFPYLHYFTDLCLKDNHDTAVQTATAPDVAGGSRSDAGK